MGHCRIDCFVLFLFVQKTLGKVFSVKLVFVVYIIAFIKILRSHIYEFIADRTFQILFKESINACEMKHMVTVKYSAEAF